MTTQNKLAEELIRRGKANGDDKLIKLGESMLTKRVPVTASKQPQEGITTVRTRDREKVDDMGNVVGKYTRSESVVDRPKINQFVDDRREFTDDPENEKLKKKPITPRARKPAKYEEVVCDGCRRKFTVPKGLGRLREIREVWRCDRCIQKMSRR